MANESELVNCFIKGATIHRDLNIVKEFIRATRTQENKKERDDALDIIEKDINVLKQYLQANGCVPRDKADKIVKYLERALRAIGDEDYWAAACYIDIGADILTNMPFEIQ
jgi:ribosomal protein L22